MWGKQVRDEMARVVQKQSETISKQKLGGKQIQKHRVVPAGGEVGITWKNVQMWWNYVGFTELKKKITKGSLGYLSSMYFSTILVLGEVVGPFLEIDGWK